MILEAIQPCLILQGHPNREEKYGVHASSDGRCPFERKPTLTRKSLTENTTNPWPQFLACVPVRDLTAPLGYRKRSKPAAPNIRYNTVGLDLLFQSA